MSAIDVLEAGFELKGILLPNANEGKLNPPVRVKCFCRFVDLRNGIDEDRWFDYVITAIYTNCFFAQDGRSRPWWAVKKFKIVEAKE